MINSENSEKKNRIKSFTIFLQIIAVLALLIWWFTSEDIRASKSLWIFFLYNFPSQFLIAIVPHEPVLLYFSKFYQPFTITLVAIIGTLIIEYFNYSVFSYFLDFKVFQNIVKRKSIKRIVDLFYKAPFLALIIAGFSPIPFYPFRFIVVIAKYPLHKYLLALFLSRTPRFYILSLFGNVFMISDNLLLILFITLIATGLIPILRSTSRWGKQKVREYRLNNTIKVDGI